MVLALVGDSTITSVDIGSYAFDGESLLEGVASSVPAKASNTRELNVRVLNSDEAN